MLKANNGPYHYDEWSSKIKNTSSSARVTPAKVYKALNFTSAFILVETFITDQCSLMLSILFEK